ncbi:phage tail tape measure protein [Faecalibacterium sp. BCRC 81149]|uniref:phage tail tape measure protein n=1 Tax=Faecalibacterium sp. BCRC 81149 TaxID=2315463 RepID=UPI001FA77A04|nr:phage tail tape measure protein [Faecalibacterium sp. BCRC 81149]MCI3216857.1 phage tail tape measure protein [Faecalibacterium sp. BCRC 81149]
MAKNQELELSILIGGHVDNSLAQAVKLANTQIGSVANGASKFAANIAKGAVAAAGGVAAGVVNTTKEAVAFESEMLDVTKYVSGLTDDNGKVVKENYDEMSKGILDLSTQIPYTAEELTRLAAAAGQSGKNMDDLLGKEQFLKDVAEMGTAMDISADQAGDWAAKWEVAFDTDHEGVMKLADQINYLGAHYATTAAEIAQTVNDTGSLGMIAGMDTDQTAALSTALLAMGVNSNTVATSIRRMYTNLTMGSKATKAQHEAFEELGFSATQFAKDMQKVDANGKSLAPEALKRLFTAIGQQDEDKQVGYLKTLLGQWAIESGAKLTGNLKLFVDTLDDVSDASKYTGSMYKEFMLKCETSESVLEMLSNAWRAVRIEVGNNFLPILKDVAGFGLDKLNDFRAALPDITARVKEVIEYLLNNGDKVAATIGGIGAAWAGMRFAPQILQVVSGVTKGVSGTATGGGKIFNGIRTIASGMSYGAQMAGIGPQPQNSFLKNIATKANGAGVGLWATLKNFTGLTKNDGKTKIDFVRDVMGASERGQTIRQSFPYINGVMSAASDFGKTKIASGIGGVTKQIFTGIIGPNGIDVAKLAGGLKNFGGATAAVFGAMPGNAAKAGVNFLSKMNFANGTGLGRTIYRMANSTQGLSGKAALAQMGYIFNQTRPGQVLSGATGFVKNAAPAVADFGGKAFGLGKAVASPVLKGGFNIFAGLMSTFGPVIAGLGSVIAVVSLLGDHFEDIRQIIGQVFGEKGLTLFDGFTGKVQGIAGNIHDTLAGAFSLENLQNIQQSLSGKSIFGIDDLGTTFGAVIPIIESVKGLIGQIVDLGVNHIKPLLADVLSFAVNDLFPAVSPLISMIISLVGTTLINAIKLVVDVIHGLLPVIEPVIQSIVGLIKGIVSVTITVVNGIIRALNSFSFTVPQWLENVPVAKNFAGKTFGFNLSEVAMPAFANGGFTRGVSIAGEAGTEAVISFKPSVHDSNVENWVRAGRMLGVSGEDATRAAGVQNVQYFANGGFTDGSKEKLDKLIDFSNAYGEYALRSNGIKSTGDVVSMMWTVANNAMSGDGSLELVATSIAADVAPIILNKYLGSDSTITKAVTEAAKTYNGGTVLSSWENGVLTDTGTPLYMLSQQDAAQLPATEAPDVPAETYQTAKESAENSASATGNEKLDNLIDFSKAYADYALRSNGIRTAGDAASMLWTVANNSLAGDGSLALAATSIAADVAPLVLNKYFGGNSTITSMLTEAAKTYNGGTVLSSWENGVLTDTGTPLYMLPQRDTEKTLPDMPSSAYRAAGGGDGGSSSSIKDSQFVFSPHITVGSGTNMEELEREMRKLFEEFKQEIREEEREQGRVKYAS